MIEFYEKVIPFHHLSDCGDFSITQETEDYYFCCIGDIGGHGSNTVYNIACTIKKFILEHTHLELEEIINLVHKQEILKNNGMTITLAKIFKTAPLLSFVSVGDVKGMIIKPSGVIVNLKSQDGIVGYTMPKTIVTNIVKINKLDIIILNTDGVSIPQKEINQSILTKNTQEISEEFASRYFKNDDDSLSLVIKFGGDENSFIPKKVEIVKQQIVNIPKKQILLKNELIKSTHNILKFNDDFKLISLKSDDLKTKEKLEKIFTFFNIDKKNIIKTSLFLLEVQCIESSSINIYYHNKTVQISINISNNYTDIVSSLFQYYLENKNLLIIDVITNNFLYEETQFKEFKELLKFGLDEEAMLLNKKLQEEVEKKLYELLEKENLNKKLTSKAYIDNLTGAFNRYKFEETFEYEMQRFKRFKHTFCIAMIDIDHFKKFNDTFGHLVGDEVLIMLANESKKELRNIDVFARWGGEEFLILFAETSLKNSVKVANKLRETIAALEHKVAGHITASFGVSQIRDNDTLDDILKRCDDALYKAKENGRNCVETETV